MLTYRLRGATGARRAGAATRPAGAPAARSRGHRPCGPSTRRDAPAIRLERRARDRATRPGRAAHPEPGDVDGDEVRDEFDNCRDVKNGSQLNTDGDAPGRRLRRRRRQRRRPDAADNCRIVANPDQDATPTATATATPARRSTATRRHHRRRRQLRLRRRTPTSPTSTATTRATPATPTTTATGFDDGYDNCPTVYNLERGRRRRRRLLNQRPARPRRRPHRHRVRPRRVASSAGPGAPAPGAGDAPHGRGWPCGVERRHRLAAVRAGLVVRLRCSEACGATVELQVSRRDRPAPRPAADAHLRRRLGAPAGRRHHLRLRALRPARAREAVPDARACAPR